MVGRKNALIVRKVSNPFSLLLSTGQPKPTAHKQDSLAPRMRSGGVGGKQS